MGIEVDKDESRYLAIAVEDAETRTTLSISHDLGLELHRQLTEYYGRMEVGEEGIKIPEPRRRSIFRRLWEAFNGKS